MLIEFKFGPNAGKFTHAERSAATQLLIDAGFISEVRVPPPQPKAPTWSIALLGEGTGSQRYVLRVDHGSGYELFGGMPAGPAYERLVRRFGEPEAGVIERYGQLLQLPSLEVQLAKSMYARNADAGRKMR